MLKGQKTPDGTLCMMIIYGRCSIAETDAELEGEIGINKKGEKFKTGDRTG